MTGRRTTVRSKTIPCLAILAGCSLLSAQAPRKPVDSHKQIQYPKLNPIVIPKVDRYTLANGMKIFLVENHELPLVHASAIIRVGSRWEPEDKAGLASLTATVMRTGGSKTLSGDALDKELDGLGAAVEFSASTASGGASVFALKKDADRGLTILADLLQNPVFPEEKIELEKIDMRDTISRRNDEPMGIAGRERRRLLYGKNSPYARQVEYSTLDVITRGDLIAFHKSFYQPENFILGVWGDFDPAEMKARIEKIFGAWPRGGQPQPAVPAADFASAAKHGVYFINKADVNQSTISVSLRGGKFNDPDYHAMVVMNEVLGGGFGSRITDEVRTRRGLAYFAGSGYAPAYDYEGAWAAQAGTKSESTIEAVQIIQAEIARIRESEITDEELQRAKDTILKGEAFDYDSTGKIVNRLMTYEYYGYPSDFLQRFRAGIEKVTKADVLKAARQRLQPDQFLVLVLGNTGKFEKPLATLGAATEVDIAIPPPKGEEVSAATPEAAEKGKALLARARQAFGGAAVVSLNGYSLKGETRMNTPQGEMAMQIEATIDLAGFRRVARVTAPMGEIVQGFDGQAAWMKMGPKVGDAPAAQSSEARLNLLRDNFHILKNFDKPGYQVQALGASELGGKKVEAVMISNEEKNLQVKFFLDPDTGLFAGRSYVGAVMGPPAEVVEVYSDYRETAGFKLPFAVELSKAGKVLTSSKVAEFRPNPELDPAQFSKPQ